MPKNTVHDAHKAAHPTVNASIAAGVASGSRAEQLGQAHPCWPGGRKAHLSA